MAIVLTGEIEEFVELPLTGVLAWTSASGEPRSVPMRYIFEDGRFYFNTGALSHKVTALRTNPVVSFSIPSEIGQAPALRALTVRGPTEISEYDPEMHLRLFTRYGASQEQAEEMRAFYTQASCVSLWVDPDRLFTNGFGTDDERATFERVLGRSG